MIIIIIIIIISALMINRKLEPWSHTCITASSKHSSRHYSSPSSAKIYPRMWVCTGS